MGKDLAEDNQLHGTSADLLLPTPPPLVIWKPSTLTRHQWACRNR
jgi:hypothetical protein